MGRCDVVLLLFVAVLGISALTHDWSAHNARAVSRLTFDYLMPLGVYWVARQSRLSERGVLRVLACLAAFGVYLGATALAEVSNAEWMVFPRYIMSAEYPEFLGRGRGPLLNPVGNGILLSTCLAAGIVLWMRIGPGRRLATLPLLLVMLAGAAVSMTRSVWMGAGLGVLIVAGPTADAGPAAVDDRRGRTGRRAGRGGHNGSAYQASSAIGI